MIYMVVPFNVEDMNVLIENIEKLNRPVYRGVAPAALFISFVGTPDELCEKLDITRGSLGTAIVVQTNSCQGYAPNTLWDWMETHG